MRTAQRYCSLMIAAVARVQVNGALARDGLGVVKGLEANQVEALLLLVRRCVRLL